ncbi:MAG: hypothetical protein IJU10_01070 [Clostridia bacterium]|nr:hypothetical protein [Clostridia bacterium]
MEEENKTTPAEIGEETTTENAAPAEEVTEAPAGEAASVEEFVAPAENATTVELRENYEEVVAENAEAKKPPKKKLGKGKLALIIVGGVLAAILLAVALFFLISWILNEDIPSEPLNTHPARPAVETTISAELQAKLDHALTSGATDAEKAEAAMELYALANVNKKNAAQCVMIAQGSGTAVVGGAAEGEMTVRAFKVQDNGVYYYQKGAKLTKVNMGTTDLLSQVLDKQERTYAPADGKYRAVMMSGTSARVGNGESDVTKVFSSELPFLNLGVANKSGIYEEYDEVITDYDEFLERAFVYGGDPKEINNFNYHKEAIRNVEIKILKDNEQKYYDITFDVDCTDEETVKVARQYLRTSSNSENLEFSSLKVNLKIWDNGYIRSFKDWEEWAGDASVKVGAFNASGSSSSVTDYEGVFYWDYDSLVADGILNAEDPDIKKDTYTADIIKKYASQPGWVEAE